MRPGKYKMFISCAFGNGRFSERLRIMLAMIRSRMDHGELSLRPDEDAFWSILLACFDAPLASR